MKISFSLYAPLISGILLSCSAGDRPLSAAGDEVSVARPPRIRPDVAGCVIPPNIAPLNFLILEPGGECLVEMGGADRSADPIRIRMKSRAVIIPAAEWRRLLSACRGGNLLIKVRVADSQGRWRVYSPFTIQVAGDSIDSHVVYRLINPAYALWWQMGIYQRDLEDFHERAVLTNRVTRRNCMNCHSFCGRRPDRMLLHMRAEYGGTVIAAGGEAEKIDTRTDQTLSAGVYPAWHPGGSHIAFSVNKIGQSFHAVNDRTINVFDKASDLIVYDVRKRTVTTSPKVSTPRLENLPEWSPDGRTLYFCSGPEWTGEKDYNKVKYDLMRIGCDVETGEWGDLETVLSSDRTGRSISFPRISPDGRFLLFCMSDYGYFSIHDPSSDLYLLDLRTNGFRKLEVNSGTSESYHSWSSNGRWFVFASKREDGLSSRLYFSHVDSSGNASKPFLLPQRDPAFYDAFILNYNVPELISGPVQASRWTLMNAATRAPVKAVFAPTVRPNPSSRAAGH